MLKFKDEELLARFVYQSAIFRALDQLGFDHNKQALQGYHILVYFDEHGYETTVKKVITLLDINPENITPKLYDYLIEVFSFTFKQVIENHLSYLV